MKIVFFDGKCAMCHRIVQWVTRLDTKKQIFFAPLQGKTAQEKLKTNKVTDSVIFLDDNTIYHYSKSCFRIAWVLGGIWSLIGWLSFLPNWLLYPADLIYKLIASNRSQSCDLTISNLNLLP
ncbi:MAG: DUF393 domain-containing protein [Chlamydiales bacterium]|nr:DUF393 domain-containing protein [Chlamydiales bacterium]